MDRVFDLTGIVIEIGEIKLLSQYFSKREFKIRYTETDFKNKIKENKVQFNIQNEDIEKLDTVRVDDEVKVLWYVDGREFNKKDGSGIMNFTTLVCYDIEILNSPTRSTEKDRNEVVTDKGKEFKDPLKEATVEELAGVVKQDPLLDEWDKKKDKYGLNDEKNAAEESMKSKILNKVDDPFSDIKENKEISDLPF
jgi:hypothetical protein